MKEKYSILFYSNLNPIFSKNLPWGKQSQAEVLSNIRKRRESADITIFRKPHATDLKTDLSRILQENAGSKEEGGNVRRLGGSEAKNKHLLYRNKMEASLPLPASPLTSPDVVPSPGPELSPSIMTQTTLETRSLNSSNSKDSSAGGQPTSEQQEGKGRLHENCSETSEESGSVLSPQHSPTARQRIRRQSTAYDEVLNQKGSSCWSTRRGSRPFLSPGDEETHRVGRRDSLSPDSAAEDTGGLRRGRRDSGGDRDSDNSRDSQTSPRSLWKRAGRRQSSSATLEEKLNKKKNKQKLSHSPDSNSSREPSPKFGEGILYVLVLELSLKPSVDIVENFYLYLQTMDNGRFLVKFYGKSYWLQLHITSPLL